MGDGMVYTTSIPYHTFLCATHRVILQTFDSSFSSNMSQTAPSWNDLLSDLNRDVSREQPTDLVQWGADWFQARLRKDVSLGLGLKWMNAWLIYVA